MPIPAAASDAPVPLAETWSTFVHRKRAVRTFIAGYCSARDQRTAPVRDSADGYAVQFDPVMGRPFEHYLIEGAPARDDGPFVAGAWVTRFGAAPLPDTLRHRTRRLATEHFMVADLQALSGDDALAHALACHTPTDVDAFNAADAFPPFRPNPAAFLFAHRIDGRFAATARYGFASPDDIVVDRVGTADAYRRRGLATQLLAAIVAHARQRGARRAWLVSTEPGRALYRAAGFAHLAPVAVDEIVA
ncbi:GCN5 family acetyltransferase [Burkholderia ubonensis]|uniref:GCN5 family acetyltransferase n=1 Tax=Burkholderia ubonensis TaxID=101571 RepID=A0A102J295_9BURK|nr:GNAT family N-acetyltransferase [Burkholderia ubonensis]AOI73517.1 GCN5 family acetyltransferase [Burkholderia ubonensis]KUZ22179.1 GCN5 family acetyltransferase [Burkholderia ubonensis]KUZ28334.1 GCN5 family acetyltransferase [Burkholderia ubonensis]KUZ39738.1 GCN5 family acetyltransferase [Burkholderia ubonensis]KUZ49102.1 GCN5 family acetyltransferase [Burkholderia ubonensis]